MAGRKQILELAYDGPEEPAEQEFEESPRPKRRTKPRSEERPGWRRRLRIFAFWCGSILIITSCIITGYKVDQFLASDPRFYLTGSIEGDHSNLRIEGVVNARPDRILDVFAPDFNRSIYLMPPAERQSGLARIDWVGSASVSRQWPNRILVHIQERTPVAFVVLPELALIDAEGAIMSQPEKAVFKLPVLLGITRQQPVSVRRARVATMLDLVRELNPLAGQLSEIDLSSPGNVVVTHTVGNRALRLLLGNRNFLPRLRTFLSHYQEVSKRLPNAVTFDLRLDDRITAVGGAGSGE